jgi:alkyldihydroxyacetonephosphate synthase
MVTGLKPAVARLYDKTDLDRHYGSVQLEGEEAYMFFVVLGTKAVAAATGVEIEAIVNKYNARDIGTKAIDYWFEHRNLQCDDLGTDKEKQRMRETNVLEFPVEMCATWDQIGQIYQEAKTTLPELVPNLVLLGAHGSHSYLNGTNLYFVVGLKIDDPKNVTAEQSVFIYGLCDIVLKYDKAGIVHHHGIGKKRVSRIKQELGTSYVLLQGLKKAFDPNGIMNPGCLMPIE